jgi:hypothetical protein
MALFAMMFKWLPKSTYGVAASIVSGADLGLLHFADNSDGHGGHANGFLSLGLHNPLAQHREHYSSTIKNSPRASRR